jgi:hypothetical protein
VTLAPLAGNPVHAWLVAAFDAVLGGRPLPSRDELERVSCFRVERFCEGSRLLCDDPSIDAIGRFARERRPDPDRVESTVARVREMYATADDPDALDDLDPLDVLAYVIETSLNPKQRVSVEVAAEVLELALPRVEQVSLDRRGALYARAAHYATHAAPHRVVELAGRAVDIFEALAEFRRREAMDDLAAALARHPPLGAFWPALPVVAHDEHAYLVGAIRLGDPRGLTRWWGSQDLTDPIERHAVLDHYLALPFDARFVEPWVGALYRRTTDRFGTNSHFTLAIVEVVDRIVRAIVDA